MSTAKGRHLAGRRKTHTQPEVALRRALHAHGARFRLHRRLDQGCTPDIVLPGRHIAVFVDGCFWHGCPDHGRKGPWTGPNAALWEKKLQRNVARDVAATALAEAQGWHVFKVWECDVSRDADGVAARILAARQVSVTGDGDS